MAHIILLADDSVTIRRVVELTFSDTDIRVESVASGAEAAERIDQIHPDLVLADVVMPPPGGYDLCRRIKESARPVPVLLLSGAFEPFDPEEARACGADGHLVKPFESRMLVDRVSSLLADPPAPAPRPGPEEAAEGAFDEIVGSTGSASAEEPGWEAETVDELAGELADAPDDAAAGGEGRSEAPAGDESAEAPVSVPILGIEPGEGVEIPVLTSPDDETPPGPGAPGLPAESMEAVVRAVVERLSDRVVREITWEVVPELAEILIRRRIREIEEEESGGR